jgi:hypothetical protein
MSAMHAAGKLSYGVAVSVVGFADVAATAASHVTLIAAEMLQDFKTGLRRVKISNYSLMTFTLQTLIVIDNPARISGQQWSRQQLYAATKTAIGLACALDDPAHIFNVEHALCVGQCLELASGCDGFNLLDASSDVTCQLFSSLPTYCGNVPGCKAYMV